MRHIVSVLLENEAGALSRVAGLFSARGYNIESLTVAPTEDATLSRMTIVTSGSDEVLEQITKQLNKLVDVVKVVDLSEGDHIERELMLVKLRAAGKERRPAVLALRRPRKSRALSFLYLPHLSPVLPLPSAAAGGMTYGPMRHRLAILSAESLMAGV